MAAAPASAARPPGCSVAGATGWPCSPGARWPRRRRRGDQAEGGTALPIRADMADYAARGSGGRADRARTRPDRRLGQRALQLGVRAVRPRSAAEEFRRVTEVTYLGYVHGTMAALTRMRPRDHGTSCRSVRRWPTGASRCSRPTAAPSTPSGVHRVAALRAAARGIARARDVVQMPAVNTPQFDWVRSRLPGTPQPVPPIYQPEVAARGVAYAADHPRRRVYWVGGSTAGDPGRQQGRARPARPVPGQDRLPVAADRRPAGQHRRRTSGSRPTRHPATTTALADSSPTVPMTGRCSCGCPSTRSR